MLGPEDKNTLRWIMKEKKFQLVTWDMPNEKKVSIVSEIYDSVDEIINAIKDNNYVIAIGLNPSNKTAFNDDETNLYLRDKIKQEFKEVKGYILTNLSYKIETESKNISIKDIDEGHINSILELIGKLKQHKIIVFFGQKGKEFLNNKNSDAKESLYKLKEELNKNKKRVYYTKSIAKFIHPGHSGDNYELVKLKNDTLEMEG